MANRVDLPTAARTLAIKAPLSGFLVPIERVPDPVFSQKMVGVGIALDPTSQSLTAPFDGVVVLLHLIVGPNVDQYAAEMAGQMAG